MLSAQKEKHYHNSNLIEIIKKMAILLTCIFCLFLSFILNLFMSIDIVYTHFFYIPLIMASLWYGYKALYIAFPISFLHIIMNYQVYGFFSHNSFYRSAFFLIIPLLVCLISNPPFVSKSIINKYPDISDDKDAVKDQTVSQTNLIGEIGSALGHELRNPMTTVRGFLQMLGDKPQYSEDQEYFHIMINEIDKANATISSLIIMADNKICQHEIKNLNHIIKDILPDLQKTANKNNINLISNLNELPDQNLDEYDIKKLIYNLTNNSFESMSAHGELLISTYNIANEIVLSVKDTGKGILPEFIDKVVDPFFTTKESSVGLGLPISYCIAKRHQAIINFTTGENGTIFLVRFPAPEQEIQQKYFGSLVNYSC